MSGLIAHYDAESGYTKPMSTKPTYPRSNDDDEFSGDESDTPLLSNTKDEASFHATILEKPTRPMSYIQNMLLHLQSDPDLTQQAIFNHIYPLFIFAIIVAFIGIGIRPGTFTHEIMANPTENGQNLIFGVVLFAAGLLASVAMLRLVIWAGGPIVNWVIRHELMKFTSRGLASIR